MTWGKIIDEFDSTSCLNHFDSDDFIKHSKGIYRENKRYDELIEALHLMESPSKKVKILDIGGRFGEHSFCLSEFDLDITYHVLETTRNAEMGRVVNGEQVSFFSDIKDLDNRYDLVYSSSSFPMYFKDWRKVLREIIYKSPIVFLLEKCVLTKDLQSFIVEQITDQCPISHHIVSIEDLKEEFNSYSYRLDKFDDQALINNNGELPDREAKWSYRVARFKKVLVG